MPLSPPRTSRRVRTVVGLAVGLVLGLAAPLLPVDVDAPAAADGSAYGARGVGDPYFTEDGNGGIDVRRYEVHDSYRFQRHRLSGWTRLTLEATQTLAGFDLDFLLPVEAVTVDGAPVPFGRPDAHELRIDAPVAAGSVHEVVVRYAGEPGAATWGGESNWLADRTEVVAMNQPHMAPWWFPANDHPADMALVDVSITVPRRMQVVSNGRRVSRRVHGHRATTRWRADEPMATYLAFFAAGRFVVRRSGGDVPSYAAVSRRVPDGTRGRMLRFVQRTPAVVRWLAAQLGPYPFSTTGGLVTSLSPGFALENQTRPTYPVLAAGSRSTLVHELAHQWFGDSVALSRWSDVWLNEGAATFMEVRWAEAHGGQPAQAWLQDRYDDEAADPDFWALDLADPGPARMFDRAVYQRGAMTLQALRHRVGEQDFWTLLRTWLDTHRGGHGTTAELVSLAEQVSGDDLTGFFAAWLEGAGRPDRTADNGLGQ